MLDFAPIVLFAYNRPWHTQQTIEALQKNTLAPSSELFIYSDAAKNDLSIKNVNEIRAYIKGIKGFKNITIVERDKNWGLANSVIAGVSEIIEKYGKAIVMEDDLISSEKFLTYMNNALNFYNENPNVFSISGYSYPITIPDSYTDQVYLSYRSSSWGWATWKDRWNKADWKVRDYKEFLNNIEDQKKFNRAGGDFSKMLQKQMNGKLDSWGIRWAYTHYKNNSFCLYPVKSQILNIGIDGTGTHVGATKKWNVNFNIEGNEIKLSNDLKIDSRIVESTLKFFKPRIMDKIILKLNSIFKSL